MSSMSLKQTIENMIYSYDANEFLPVFRDGSLDNRGEFIAYKAEKAAGILGHLTSRTLEATRTAGALVIEHIAADPE